VEALLAAGACSAAVDACIGSGGRTPDKYTKNMMRQPTKVPTSIHNHAGIPLRFLRLGGWRGDSFLIRWLLAKS
jgi:hypothetical protein